MVKRLIKECKNNYSTESVSVIGERKIMEISSN